MNKHLIIGYGEVGRAIDEVLGGVDFYDLDVSDYEGLDYEFLHICIPYSKDFIDTVKDWQTRYPDSITIIHSTVPVGTSRKLGAVHSPVRGVHPDLVEGIETFVKYFGGEQASRAAEIFEKLGIKTFVTDKPENTEAGKLWSTEYYRTVIKFMQEVHDDCKKRGLDFGIVYNGFNKTYNDGYKELDKENVVRPVLHYMGKEIGGHCVEPNHKLIYGRNKKEN